MKNWTHKVVKQQRGSQGEWFAYPAAATFAGLGEAVAYAEAFAADQRENRVKGTRITVQTRGRSVVKSIAV